MLIVQTKTFRNFIILYLQNFYLKSGILGYQIWCAECDNVNGATFDGLNALLISFYLPLSMTNVALTWCFHGTKKALKCREIGENQKHA